MEVVHGPLTEAAHMQGLGVSGSNPGLRLDAASRQGLGPGPPSGSGRHWLNYATPLHRMREFGIVGVHVGALDCMMIDQDLAPATMHRYAEELLSIIGDIDSQPFLSY